MNLLQIIVSESRFHTNLMLNLPDDNKFSLTKTIFKNLSPKPFNDDTIFNKITGNFVENGFTTSIKKFIMMTNSNLNLVFKKQLSEEMDTSTYICYSILKYAGFTAQFVKDVLKTGVLTIIFDTLAIALLAFFSVSTIGIGIYFLAAFLAIITQLFIVWIGDEINRQPWIKKSFDKGIADLYARFSKNDIDSLDYENVLQSESEKKMVEFQDTPIEEELNILDDRTEFFNENFDFIWEEYALEMFNIQKGDLLFI